MNGPVAGKDGLMDSWGNSSAGKLPNRLLMPRKLLKIFPIGSLMGRKSHFRPKYNIIPPDFIRLPNNRWRLFHPAQPVDREQKIHSQERSSPLGPPPSSKSGERCFSAGHFFGSENLVFFRSVLAGLNLGNHYRSKGFCVSILSENLLFPTPGLV